MRGALKPLLLTLLYVTLTHAETLQFPALAASCTGGGANDEHLHPEIITCTREALKWRCASTPLHDSFLRIHHARVHCDDASCKLEYKLDFTPLAVFVIGFLATFMAGLFLAVAMYLAVVRMAERFECDAERERFVEMRRPGYGSFGGKLYSLGKFTDSFDSLLDFDVEEGFQSDVETGESEEGKEEKGEKGEKERAELVEREIYLG